MPRLLLSASIVITLPGLYMRVSGIHATPFLGAVIFGFAIFGAAFLLAWAAEVAQLEISQALAVAILAVIAVLPEYAVDMYFAWRAADDPVYASYATANMTGANRLLVGLGWPVVVLLFAWKFKKRSVSLSQSHSTEVAYLGLATLYAFTIPLKGSLSLLDAAILILIFGGYVWRVARAEVKEPDLIGPAAYIGSLSRRARLASTIALFIFSGTAILLVAEPFSEALIDTGTSYGIDRYKMVQWVAPIASEAPEFIIASLWALRGDAEAGLAALVSSKVNQWTLLIGTLPIVYSFSLGAVAALPLDGRQEIEIYLTAAQSIFAVALLADLKLNIFEAVALFVLFAVQLVFEDTHLAITAIYIPVALIFLYRRRAAVPTLLRRGFLGSAHADP